MATNFIVDQKWGQKKVHESVKTPTFEINIVDIIPMEVATFFVNKNYLCYPYDVT